MARDYKHMANAQTRRRQSPPWVWLLTGLLIGLFVAFLVYLGEHREGTHTPLPRDSNHSSAADPPNESVREEQNYRLKPPVQADQQKPTFEFYTILPEAEVQVSEQEVTTRPRSSAGQSNEKVNRAVDRSSYILQVGSFRHHQDADRLKAQLALMGLQADIQVVSLGGEDTWHRVRLGPYQDLRTLDQARDRLSEHDLQAIVLKQKN